MMKSKFLLILISMVLLSSCGSKKAVIESSKGNGSKTEIKSEGQNISYKSLGNDLATISLEFKKDNSFIFNMNGFGDEEEDAKPIVIVEKGKYTSEGVWKTLVFNKPKFDLAAVFDSKYASADAFKVIDNETVKINTSKEALPIWGVLCERQ